ncbi:hypothetical protein [Synechococcus sp. CC9616]|uniref:hypothetical protein n=1 Tax=Synechococcus sp. CC9616 TaxID=110663 RepID=UPI00048A5DD1|nr:hypothetical protein [Synechococcus sp. CC9616]
MRSHRSRYRLAGLDGQPHPVLDTTYDSLESALTEALNWCSGQGASCAPAQRGIAVQVCTGTGAWRTIDYPRSCLVQPSRNQV